MPIQKNDTQYQEERIEDLYDDDRSSKTNATIIDILERIKTLNEEIRVVKREHEIQ